MVVLLFWLYMGWMDYCLIWNLFFYFGIDSIVIILKYVWFFFFICLYNEINEDKCFIVDKLVMIMLFGWMMYVILCESVIQCVIDIIKYLFDFYMCSFYFGNLVEIIDFLIIMED